MEGIKLSKFANTTATERRDTSFIDVVTSMISNANAFEATEYRVSFLDAGVNEFVDDMMSSDFFSSDSRSTYARQIHVTRLVFKQITVLLVLEDLSEEGAGTQNLGVTHVDDGTI